MSSSRDIIEHLSKNFNINYTDSQREAVLNTKGNTLLLAAPGSGKTTVIIGRIGNLILNYNVDPKSIMAVTFSKASAIDLDDRFSKLFGDIIEKRPAFSTIHSFSMTILKEYALKKGISFKLIEDESSKVNKRSIIRECYRKINSEYLTEDKLEAILSGISYAKNMMLKKDEIKSLKVGIKDFYNIYNDYENTKKENRFIDYDDMLTYALNILKTDKGILTKYRDRYKYIICDEAQDVSKIQHAILWMVGKDKDGMFLVADDDQSIYGFRGSMPDILKQFNKLYENTNTMYIEQNFRSTKKIVDLTNKFIKTNKNRYDKNIYTENATGKEVEIKRLDNEDDEIKYLVDEINKCKDEGIGILYRNNISAVPLANKLSMLNIPFYIRDNKINIFNHWIIDDIKAFLDLSEDETNLKALEKVYFKTDSYISRSIIDYIKANHNPNESVFNQLFNCPLIEGYHERSIISFKRSLEHLKRKDPYSIINYIENDMKYLDYLNSSVEEGSFRGSLQEVISVLKEVAKGLKTIEEFFRRLGELKKEVEMSRFNKNKTNITLTTIHSAKGLEYDKVYLINLYEGNIPGIESIEEEKLGNTSLIEEERRLFYVGLTRAKRDLRIISTREKNFKRLYPSRFIGEVNKILSPEALNENISYDVEHGINIGDTVIHKAFGQGIVYSIEGDSIEINFFKLGFKKLLLSICLEGKLLYKG